MTGEQKVRLSLIRAATDRDNLADEQAAIAAARLAEGDYSAAATACHRAYQHRLIATELTAQANR